MVFAALALLLQSATPSPSPTPCCIAHRMPPGFVDRPFVDRWADFPKRPHDSDGLNVATGVFESYQVVTGPEVAIQLILRDSKTGADMSYFVAPETTLDGKPLRCDEKSTQVRTPTLMKFELCLALPADIIPGKTYLAVLFWKQPYDFGSIRLTDTIESVPAASPSPIP